jgi:hypothetical protein
VRWSHRVTAISQDAENVRVLAETPDGNAQLQFQYLVACDGVRSALRDLVGVAWTGYSHADRFLITDIRARLPLAKGRHFHYDPSFNPGRQLVIHPQPNDIWRIDWQLPPDTDIEAERRTGAFDQRVRAVIGEIPYEIDWLSTYRFHQRVVDRFVVGRVFFAGDAAHSLPPYGSRGMNSGVQDADNLAWKLALVLQGHTDHSLLETYHDERYAAAQENLAVTEATIRFMVPPTRSRRWIRAALLGLAKPVGAVRRHINSGRMAEPYVYSDSPLVDSTSCHPLLGHFAPDGWVSAAGRRERIRTLFGAQFVVVYFGTDASAARRFVHDSFTGRSDLPVRLVLVLPARTEIGDLPAQVTVVHDENSRLRTDYHVRRPTWMLIRPDGHIAAAGATPAGRRTGLRLRAALLQCTRATERQLITDKENTNVAS